MNNYDWYARDFEVFDEIREHLPDELREAYESALDTIHAAVSEMAEDATHLSTIGDVAPRLHTLADAIQKIR